MLLTAIGALWVAYQKSQKSLIAEKDKSQMALLEEKEQRAAIFRELLRKADEAKKRNKS